MSIKTNHKPLIPVNAYIEENKISEPEFWRRVINYEIDVLCWVDDLPLVYFLPISRHENDGVEEFLYSVYIQRMFCKGLIYTTANTTIEILKQGSASIKDRIWITNHSYQSNQENKRHILIPENIDILTRSKITASVIKKSLNFTQRNFINKVLQSSSPVKHLSNADLLNIDSQELVTWSSNLTKEINEYIKENKYFLDSWWKVYAFASTFHSPTELTLKMYLNKELGIDKWGLGSTTSRLTDRLINKELMTKIPPYVASRSDLVVVSDMDTYFKIKSDLDASTILINNEDNKHEESSDTPYSDNYYVQLIEEVSEKFWGGYNSNDRSTIPAAKEIIEWLICERNIPSATQAKHIEVCARSGRQSPPGRPKNK